MNALLWAAGGTGFTFIMTTFGAAMVFLFRGKIQAAVQRIILGFADGVMVAALVGIAAGGALCWALLF